MRIRPIIVSSFRDLGLITPLMILIFYFFRSVQTVGHADIFQDPQGNWRVTTTVHLLISNSLYRLGGLLLCPLDRGCNMLTILWDAKLF